MRKAVCMQAKFAYIVHCVLLNSLQKLPWIWKESGIYDLVAKTTLHQPTNNNKSIFEHREH